MIRANASSSGIAWQIKNDGFMEFDKQNVTAIGTATTSIPNRVWSHVAVTYDASGNYAFYVNGSPAGSGTNLQGFATSDTWIGKQNGASSFFKGFMDNMRIYNAVLTATQIQDLYYGIEPPTTNLKLLYKFDEGSGTSATDSSGLVNTGTITGGNYSTNVFTSVRSTVA